MSESDKPQKPAKIWASTRVQHLLKNTVSGRYYARFKEDGKQRWKSLGTDHFGVAQAKLAELLLDRKKRQAAAAAAASGKMTFGQALDNHLKSLERAGASGAIKPNTLKYWKQTAEFLLKIWPGVEKRELRKISATDCEEWAATVETSDSRFNNTVSLIRNVFQIGIKCGLIYENPATEVKKVTVRKKDLTLPTKAQFRVILDAMRATSQRGGYDLAAGLAFTGMRIDEAINLKWGDVDFDHREIIVRGDPETRTKNDEIRHVPMTGEALTLFQRLKAESNDEKGKKRSVERWKSGYVFVAMSCIKSLQRACKIAGAKSISHHDLRHYFATACIESGVDIPTISRWLGHKDGGALAMKTYGHLRREHSAVAAAKVRF